MLMESSQPLNFPLILKSTSPEETIAIGKDIASLLKPGSVAALKGSLGAGKTCLTKGIAKALGIEEEITSPTYTIVSEYQARPSLIPFYHIDAYRLSGDDDFTAMGGEEYLGGNGIAVVEWSERIPSALPRETLFIEIEITGNEGRTITIKQDIL
ncbi:tRNA (adenosine(37)-N6)-threonylcarbamoyltransferase complex ATPase subunit type 1 TsaE [Spirochaetia bacterium]|nr:tRNA (adenosine(37)-N6)-threonylcarbamoyltransferase complex ATPase subunit type 1 TsaE [Spirochaetia bacterium]